MQFISHLTTHCHLRKHLTFDITPWCLTWCLRWQYQTLRTLLIRAGINLQGTGGQHGPTMVWYRRASPWSSSHAHNVSHISQKQVLAGAPPHLGQSSKHVDCRSSEQTNTQEAISNHCSRYEQDETLGRRRLVRRTGGVVHLAAMMRQLVTKQSVH